MTRYTRLAVALHWLIAAIVVAQIAWGWLMQEIPKSPPGLRADAFNLHKSIGLCIFALMLVRLGWRLAHPPPPPLLRMPRWQAQAARLTHGALYAALFVMPIAGYLGSVFSGYPVKWFGITLPGWYPKAPLLKAWMSDVHRVTSVVLVSIIALHVAAALHHAWRGDGVMARMSFGGSSGKTLNARAAAPLRAPARFPRA
ncbi:MAG TPA: cytochrome b [Casimicrobiaceae bacterium]|nr:cytochrome b [Casimicrobiaceae bacterium]